MGRAKIGWSCVRRCTCSWKRSSPLSRACRELYEEHFISSQFKTLVRGEMGACWASWRFGSGVHVDIVTDDFFELLEGEDSGVTALTRRECRCTFYSSPRKAHASRLQRTRPFRTPWRTVPHGQQRTTPSLLYVQTQLPALECCTAGLSPSLHV